MRQRGNVHLDDLELALEIRFMEVAVRPEAGVVHERDDSLIDRAEPRREMLSLQAATEVGCEGLTHDSVPLAQRPREQFQGILASSDDDQIVAVAREEVREFA